MAIVACIRSKQALNVDAGNDPSLTFPLPVGRTYSQVSTACCALQNVIVSHDWA